MTYQEAQLMRTRMLEHLVVNGVWVTELAGTGQWAVDAILPEGVQQFRLPLKWQSDEPKPAVLGDPAHERIMADKLGEIMAEAKAVWAKVDEDLKD